MPLNGLLAVSSLARWPKFCVVELAPRIVPRSDLYGTTGSKVWSLSRNSERDAGLEAAG